MGQGGFGAHSEAKLVSQFMQTKFLCHKMSQNSTVLTVSSSSDCILVSDYEFDFFFTESNWYFPNVKSRQIVWALCKDILRFLHV